MFICRICYFAWNYTVFLLFTNITIYFLCLLFQEKYDEYSEKEKAAMDDSSFEQLERDFHEVTNELFTVIVENITWLFTCLVWSIPRLIAWCYSRVK